MSGTETFSIRHIGCLFGPYVIGFVLLGLQSVIRVGGFVVDLIGYLLLITCAVQFAAVCWGVAKIIWQERYRNAGNILLTALPAAPWILFLIGIFVVKIPIHF